MENSAFLCIDERLYLIYLKTYLLIGDIFLLGGNNYFIFLLSQQPKLLCCRKIIILCATKIALNFYLYMHSRCINIATGNILSIFHYNRKKKRCFEFSSERILFALITMYGILMKCYYL